jgi:hypothetical protein
MYNKNKEWDHQHTEFKCSMFTLLTARPAVGRPECGEEKKEEKTIETFLEYITQQDASTVYKKQTTLHCE